MEQELSRIHPAEEIMTEEKKTQIRKRITAIEIALAVALVLYVVYGIVTKSSNPVIFNALAILVVVSYVALNDFVEPYFTEVFKDMDEFRKEAYKKYLMWDVASMAGLLFFVLNFSQEGNMGTYIGIALYFIGSKQKRPYQSAYLGRVTKADVEAAKAAVVDAEAIEIEDAEEVQETTEAAEE